VTNVSCPDADDGPATDRRNSQGNEVIDIRSPTRKRQTRKAHNLFPTISIDLETQGSGLATPAADKHSLVRSQTSPKISPPLHTFHSTTTEERISDVFSPNLSLGNSSTCSTPFSSPPSTPVRLCSPVDLSLADPSDNDFHIAYGDQGVQDIEDMQRIGELGRRRGFKGTPLFTPATAKNATFLAVPLTSSPCPSRSPLVSMTNLRKSPKRDKQRLAEAKRASPAMQEDFDLSDPFGMKTDSYYAPEVVHTILPSANLYRFSVYCDETPERTPSLKRKPAMLDLHSPLMVRTAFRKPGHTNVYDVAIYQFDGTPTKPKSRSKTPPQKVRPYGIKITAPNVPPSAWNDSPTRIKTRAIAYVVSTDSALACNPRDTANNALGHRLRKVSISSAECQDIDLVDMSGRKHSDLGTLTGCQKVALVANSRNSLCDNTATTLFGCPSGSPLSRGINDHQEIYNAGRSTGGSVASMPRSTAVIRTTSGSRPLGDVSFQLKTNAASYKPSMYSRLRDYFEDTLDSNGLGSEVKPVRLASSANYPKQASGLRPLVLPMQIATKRDGIAAPAADPGYSVLTSYLPFVTSGQRLLACRSPLEPSGPSAGTLPLQSNPEDATKTVVNDTRLSIPVPAADQRSKALDNILALLAAADLNIRPQNARASYGERYNDCRNGNEREGRWSDVLNSYAI
jgi:hypothetical protein